MDADLMRTFFVTALAMTLGHDWVVVECCNEWTVEGTDPRRDVPGGQRLPCGAGHGLWTFANARRCAGDLPRQAGIDTRQ